MSEPKKPETIDEIVERVNAKWPELLTGGLMKTFKENPFPVLEKFEGEGLSIEKIAELMGERWHKELQQERTIIYGTGREGAINAEIMLIKAFFPERSEIEIRAEVESKIWEDGQYIIGGENYIEYNGLHDHTHPDGIFGIVVRGLNYVEYWKGGSRIQYKIVSDEEFEKIKKENDAKLFEEPF